MAEKNYPCPSFPHLIHGADYNPEQWIDDKTIWDADMELMRKAHCNEMTVGIFSWAKLEPREGEYDFRFLDEVCIMDTATMGPWARTKYTYGGIRNVC